MKREDHLVSTSWLAEHLDDPDLRVFDATIHLARPPEPPRSGRADYEAGHIPGAGFLDLATELADPAGEHHFTRPPIDRLESVLSRAGITTRDRVVAYSTSHPMWATRLWWILRSAGVARCALLDGGFAKWVKEGRPVTTDPCAYPETHFEGMPREDLWADRDQVLAAIEDAGVCTINALPSQLHTGEAAMGYARPGHVRGSKNVPFTDVIDSETGLLKADATLREHFDATGALNRSRVITYCGGGIAATLDAFALTILGHENVAVYDGSLSEWAADPTLPMETG